MNYQFSELLALIDPALRVAFSLAGLVHTHPDQVTACCCLYMAAARFLTVVRCKRI